MPEITDIRTKPLQTVAYILLPVLIGLTVICYLFWKEFDPHIFTHVSFPSKQQHLSLLLLYLCWEEMPD